MTLTPLQAAEQVLPVSDKHHVNYKMLLMPSKHAFVLYDPKTYTVVENVANRQWGLCVVCYPTNIARVFGVSVTPIPVPEAEDEAKWLLLVSYKKVPLAEVVPKTIRGYNFSVFQTVVGSVNLLDQEKFDKYKLTLKGD